jgi:hypothetical protein
VNRALLALALFATLGAAQCAAALPYLAAAGAGATGAAAVINADVNALHTCHQDGGCKELLPP